LALASELASLTGLVGAGDTGDTIGITTTFVSITTAMYPTAEFSPIATTSIAAADLMEPTDFMAAQREDSHHMPRPELIRERSADSIMEESQEDSLLAGSQALVEASTVAVAVSTAVEAGEGNFGSTKTNETDDTEKEHAHKQYDA
jgi:Fe-S cluster assembly scaffold protein SufB